MCATPISRKFLSHVTGPAARVRFDGSITLHTDGPIIASRVDRVLSLWQDDTPIVSFVPALLRALVSLDGEALVLHPGDKPYVAAPGGPVELSSKPLTTTALTAVLAELLPADSLAALEASGSIEWERPANAELPDERFVVVAARVDDEPWVEVRRTRPAAPPQPPNPRGPDDDDLKVPAADEFWPARIDEDVDDSF